MLESKEKYFNQVITTSQVGYEISEFAKSKNVSQIVIFTQDKIKKDMSWANSISDHVVILGDSEKAKDISSALDSINYLAQINADRDTLLIAYGGGSVSDHVGFVASIFNPHIGL